MNDIDKSDDFTVDLSTIHLNRKNGISGMMRVRNDSEFIKTCIESCIDALDELIVVYNDCSDTSPEEIEQMRLRYPEKIKVYNYKPTIYAWNVSKDTANDIIHGNINPIHTLAGYYNYALSKTTYRYVLKIDADQIYHNESLKKICDLYRVIGNKENLTLLDDTILLSMRCLMSISSRIERYINVIYNKKFIYLYHRSLSKFILKNKVSVSLSGINVALSHTQSYISLGKFIQEGVNIMGPFNGEGDHLIFEVKNGIRFEPIIDNAYNRLNGGKLNVIEQLLGVRNTWKWGEPMWIHLNSCRMNIWAATLKNIRQYPDSYIEFNSFFRGNYKKIVRNIDDEIFSKYRKKMFHFVFSSSSKSTIDYFSRICSMLRNTIYLCSDES